MNEQTRTFTVTVRGNTEYDILSNQWECEHLVQMLLERGSLLDVVAIKEMNNV